jgi:F0F1-type ATP synthase epsilon subunit
MILTLISFDGETVFHHLISVSVRTSKGWIQILPGHQDFWADCQEGFLSLAFSDQKKAYIQTRKGLLDVKSDQLLFLTSQAELISPENRVHEEKLHDDLKNKLEKDETNQDLKERCRWLEERFRFFDSQLDSF